MKNSICSRRFLLICLLGILMGNQAYAKKKIEPQYNPVERKLPLKVSVEDFWCEVAYLNEHPALSVYYKYFYDDIKMNYIDSSSAPLGTIDIRLSDYKLTESGVLSFTMDILDLNNNLVRSYIYEYVGKAKLSNVLTHTMDNFRSAYILDYDTIFTTLQNPKPITKATLVICAPNSSDKEDKLKYFVELDGKRVGFLRDKGFLKIETTSGRHKVAVYPNFYWEPGFMNFSRSKRYINDPVEARNISAEILSERVVYISNETFLDARKLERDNEYSSSREIFYVSKDQVNEWLSFGMLENPANNQQTTINLAAVPTISTISSSNNQQTTSAQPTTPSDVDVNISQSTGKSRDTYVLIISNEQYEYLDKVNYATHDGEIFKEYCTKTLGIPEKQIFYYTNATFGKITDGVEKLKYCLNNFENSKAIVYYCGHGIPDEKTGQAFLIPVDGKGTNMTTCYSLNTLYKTLANTKAQSITYFMDACFTGANKEGSMLVAARGVARAPEKEVLTGKTVVFSASSGDETAMTLNEEGHGLFTYYLLKKLQETEGNVSYGELADYINQNVKKDAFLINEKPQTPVVAISPAVVNTWRNMKLK